MNKEQILQTIKEERKVRAKEQLKIIVAGVIGIWLIISMFTIMLFMVYILPQVVNMVGYEYGWILSLGILGVIVIPIILILNPELVRDK